MDTTLRDGEQAPGFSSTDVIEASARASLSALNRLLQSGQRTREAGGV